ncbi:phosphotransferase family protein [Shewanella denitrificans]
MKTEPSINLSLKRLVENPSYADACDILDERPLEFWLPTIEVILSQHQLAKKTVLRISNGSNALFDIDNEYILKLVPPNWDYQGISEVTSLTLLNLANHSENLSLAVPKMIGFGRVDNWFYVIMTKLKGLSMATVWPDLNTAQKLPLVKQLGQFMTELHQITSTQAFTPDPRLSVDWPEYIKGLISDSVPRHARKGVSPELVTQISDYLQAADSDFNDIHAVFIHMDLHPWNLMVEKHHGHYRLCGVVDFGDALVGNCQLLELATPIIFVCQGNKTLIDELVANYSPLNEVYLDRQVLQRQLMAVSLIRPACDFNFVLQQVPQSGKRDSWQAIAKQLFPLYKGRPA